MNRTFYELAEEELSEIILADKETLTKTNIVNGNLVEPKELVSLIFELMERVVSLEEDIKELKNQDKEQDRKDMLSDIAYEDNVLARYLNTL